MTLSPLLSTICVLVILCQNRIFINGKHEDAEKNVNSSKVDAGKYDNIKGGDYLEAFVVFRFQYFILFLLFHKLSFLPEALIIRTGAVWRSDENARLPEL